MNTKNLKLETKNCRPFSGFSLPEVLVVVSIAALLTTVILGSIAFSRQNARDLKRISDIKEIQFALALYHDVHRDYPNNLDGLLSEKFINLIPQNPQGSSYSYQYNSSEYKYCIGVALEKLNPVDIDGNKDCLLSGSDPTTWYKTQP